MKLFNRRGIGAHYEETAMNFLKNRGLTLLDKNFTCKCGELDIVMQDACTLVFIEVKYRKNQSHGHAAEAVTYSKAQKLIKSANLWMLKRGLSPHTTDFRFDVVAIHNDGKDIDWFKNAITQE